MPAIQNTTRRQSRGESPLLEELSAIYESLDDSALIRRLWQYRWTGRRGHSPRSLWRAVLAGHYLNIPTTIGLARRLQEDSALCSLCGFIAPPSRITIGRFLGRLLTHFELVQDCLTSATKDVATLLDGFGQEWAIDSTTVTTYASPNRRVPSDPDASWTRKPNSQGKTAYHYGYRLHVVCDANYELPIHMEVMTASINDIVTLVPLVDTAIERLGFRPQALSADRGYDSIRNVNGLLDLGIRPVVKRIDRSTPQQGAGSRVRKDGMARRSIDQDAEDWQAIYDRRSSVERLFSRLKGHRSLIRHSRRRLGPVALHCLLALMVMQANALAHARRGDIDGVRECARRVA